MLRIEVIERRNDEQRRSFRLSWEDGKEDLEVDIEVDMIPRCTTGLKKDSQY